MSQQIDQFNDDCDNPAQDFHGARFRCGDGTDAWQDVTVRFAKMRQQGWGEAMPLSLSDVTRLHVRTATSTPQPFACDFWIKAMVLKNGTVMEL